MKAIYKGKLYSIIGDNGSEVQLQSLDSDVDMTLWVSYGFGAPDFIIDPTDDEINNILPDYFEEKGLVKLPPIDQIVGCNVHGRLTYVRSLLWEAKTYARNAEAIHEIDELLKFFAKP